MKLSDYIAEFLARQGIKHVFAITGGASIHMIHSIGARDDIDYVCPAHEQAGGFMADAYSRVTGWIGCAMATSGPGATNLITAIASAWFDSIPVLFITGQVTTNRLKGDLGVRQIGFQETDIVSMVKPVTKYAVMITHLQRVRYELEKALFLARSGRPGPVLLDIPDDLQRTDIDPSTFDGFFADPYDQRPPHWFDIEQAFSMLSHARRPVLVLGQGVRLSGVEKVFIKLAERLQVPILPTWAMLDALPSDHPLVVGPFGTQGGRAGNFTAANADLVFAIGARLGTRETGSPVTTFARSAKTIMVDIDKTEIAKFDRVGRPIDLKIACDAGGFIDGMNKLLSQQVYELPNLNAWWNRIRTWQFQYPAVIAENRERVEVDPYRFVELLAERLGSEDQIFSDTGCSVAWLAQAFRFKSGQRFYHAWNNTPMGWALPAGIGGWFASKKRSIVVSGDGGLMMNMQEMATAAKHRCELKLFVMNNQGHAMCQQTEDEWLGGSAHASSVESGLAFPDWVGTAQAAGWQTAEADLNADLDKAIEYALATPGPVLVDIRLSANHRVYPKSKYGFPIEDSEPLLPRGEFLANMIVDPMEISR